MSSEEVDALLVEMEPEIRAAERDLREIDLLEKRGVLAAGNLAGMYTCFPLYNHRNSVGFPITEHESLRPRLEALQKEIGRAHV